MKLRKKISLLCGLVLVLVVGICSLILIGQTKDNLLNLAYTNAGQKQRSLVSSFRKMLSYYHEEQDSAVTSRSLMKYCFTQVADEESVLVLDGETVSSSFLLDPGNYLIPDPGNQQQRFTGMVDGRRLIIVGSSLRLSYAGDSLCCNIYVVQDITSVYRRIHSLAWQFASIGAICIGLGLLLIAFLVQRSLRPLQALKSTASRIAEGNYTERADVSSADEIGALAKDFNLMADAVQQRIEELTETAERQRLFISGVTHESKTPLTALLLNADSLQNTYLEEEERDAALSRIVLQCRWLERLVQKLLKLITLRQKPELQRVQIADLFSRVQENTSDTLFARGVILETARQVEYLNLDADLMQSVLINLVDNAGKASGSGQTILLSADETGFTVQDHGCGIPQDEIRRITDPFYMVDRSRSKNQGGVGLGLALAKEIVQAHGGQLIIESIVGTGTTVRVLLQQ
ncbi:MAG: HAMP domain-containing histidine kinase [Oscillospiraceae bacterium]|nr:HAMP domain-containing histidine kinase [Oscillospiraceae bacterium]